MEPNTQKRTFSQVILIVLLSGAMWVFYITKQCFYFIFDNILDGTIFTIIFLVVISLCISYVSEDKIPNITLNRSDWHCSKVEERTYLQPVALSKTTTMVPTTDKICVEYSRD